MCPVQQKGDKKLARVGGDSAGFYMEKMYKIGEENWRAEKLLKCTNQCKLAKAAPKQKWKEQGWVKGRN